MIAASRPFSPAKFDICFLADTIKRRQNGVIRTHSKSGSLEGDCDSPVTKQYINFNPSLYRSIITSCSWSFSLLFRFHCRCSHSINLDMQSVSLTACICIGINTSLKGHDHEYNGGSLKSLRDTCSLILLSTPLLYYCFMFLQSHPILNNH